MTTRRRDRDTFNAAWRRWYAKNADRKIAWQARRRAELRAWIAGVKATLCCERCGESAPECLHFHHRDPGAKELDISRAIVNGWARERIVAELAKCEVLCANCHLKHHWEPK